MTHTTKTEDPRHGEVSLARKVSRMGMLIHRYYEAKAQQHGGMGDPLRGQGRVLALLKAKPETTQRELSFLLDMRQQSLSELLAKLEEKGYVTREKSAEDGRVTVVRLTDEGAAAAPSPEQMSQRADALDCLSEEEQEQLDTLTSKVTASLEQKLEEMGIDPHRGPRGPRGQGHGHGHEHDGSRDRRGPRPQGQGDRGGRRDDRSFRGDRGPRDDRGFRGDRGPRDDRGFRGDRSPRDDRDQRGYRDRDDHSRRGPYRPDDDHRMHRA